eukprot:gene15036-biopygen5814
MLQTLSRGGGALPSQVAGQSHTDACLDDGDDGNGDDVDNGDGEGGSRGGGGHDPAIAAMQSWSEAA